MSQTIYTLSNLLDECAESPKHSKADAQTFKMVWGGLMAWSSSNWMTGKGDVALPAQTAARGAQKSLGLEGSAGRWLWSGRRRGSGTFPP